MNRQEIKKVAVLKGPGIGDVITSIPMLRILKKNLPDAEIVVFNEVSYGIGKKVLEDCPYVDRFTEINQTSFFNLLRIIRKIRKEKFDIIIDSFPSTWKTALFVRLSGAKKRLGYYQNSLSFFYNVKANYKHQNKIDLEAELMEKLGLRIGDKELELFFDLKSKDGKIKEMLKKNSIKSSDFLVGVHVGRTGDVVRTWVDERWAELCDKLVEKYKARIIFIGGEKDKERTGRIINLMKNDAVNLAGEFDLVETAVLVNNIKLFLCINGGPMHIAAALKKPLIALTGDTKPGWDPYGKNSHVIRECQGKYRDTHFERGSNHCMRMIEVVDVLKKIEEVLNR